MTITPRGHEREYGGACRTFRGPAVGLDQQAEVSLEPGVNQIVIIGGGPAGYEAALVAAQLGAGVTVVEAEGAGGACVLSDCVPSKAFIAASDVVTGYRDTEEFGIHAGGLEAVSVDAKAVHARVKRLARAQSGDIQAKLVRAGVTFVPGTAT